jgi:hypothetical protein
MTLVASFSIGDFSFILGDLLLSGPEQANQTLHLPSIGDVTQVFPQGAGRVPTSLERKVCHFSNIAVAWAGQYIPARTMIRELFKETQENGPMSLEKLDNVFQNLDPWLRKTLDDGEVALLGYLIDPRDRTGVEFGANYSHLSSSILDNVRIAGSGSRVFQEYFDHRRQSGLELITGAEEKSFEAAVCMALTLTGMLLQLEIGTYGTLLRYFGGGYELISLERGGRFHLCDDLIYAFWFAYVDDEGTTLSPVMKFFKQNYFRDILIIRTLEMKSQDPRNPILFTVREDEVHYFPPMYRELTHQERSTLPKPDLNAFMLCSYILVQSHKGIEVLAKFDWSKRREIPLRFADDGRHMMMQMQQKHLEGIFNSIESRK